VKLVLVDAFSRSLFRQLGDFAAIDANGDGVVTPLELASALEKLTAKPASPVSVNLVLDALDGNGDRLISADEAQKVRREPNR
jgi:hypothetical protein